MVRHRRHGSTLAIVVPVLLSTAINASATADETTRTATRQRSPVSNVAHRGASHLAPENTMAAVLQAIASGSDFVGIDIRRTRNDKLVVLHDSTLKRTTDVESVYPRRSPWQVSDFSLREIRRLDAGRSKSRDYTGEAVPSLADVLRELEPSPTGAFLEVKSPRAGTLRLVHRAIRRYTTWLQPARRERLVVQSFDEAFVHRYHRRHAAVTTSVLGRFGVADMDDVDWSDQVNTPFRAVLRRPRLVRAAHRHGLDVAVHTVNGPRRMRQVLDAGVDAVSTDRPVRLDRVLAGRGQRRQRDERLAAPTQWSVRAPDHAWLATRFQAGGRLSTAGAQASRWQWVSVQTRGRNGWRTWQRRVTDRHGRLSTTLWLGRDLPMRFRADGEGARPAVASPTHHVDGRRMPSNATLRGPQRLRESRTARLRVQWFADDGRAVSGPVRLYEHESDGDWDRIRSARLTDGRHAFRVRPGDGARYRLSARRGWWWRGDGDRHRIARRG